MSTRIIKTLTVKIKYFTPDNYSSIQEGSAIYGRDELNADISSSFRGNRKCEFAEDVISFVTCKMKFRVLYIYYDGRELGNYCTGD